MKRCTHCNDHKYDKEFSLTKRLRQINSLDEGVEELDKVVYLQSWCRECTIRQLRIKRGTQTSLDIATEISIELGKEWRRWMRE